MQRGKLFENFVVLELDNERKAFVSYATPITSSTCKFQQELCEFCAPLLSTDFISSESQPSTRQSLNATPKQSDYESPENSFILLLKDENIQFYAVCVRSPEPKNFFPSFFPNQPLNNEYDVNSSKQGIIRCYCLLSSEPLFEQHFTVLYTLLAQERMFKLLINDKLLANEPIDDELKTHYGIKIIESYASLILPENGKSKSYSLTSEISCEISITGGDSDSQLTSWVAPLLLRTLTMEEIAALHCALLQETPIIIKSSSLGLVSIVILGLNILLSPLKWQGPIIPILPPSLQEYLESPVPLILGLYSPYFTKATFHPDYFILDIDTHKYILPERLIIQETQFKSLITQLHKLETNLLIPLTRPKLTSLNTPKNNESTKHETLARQALKLINEQTQQVLTILNEQMVKNGDEIESYNWETLPITIRKHLSFFKRITESQSFSVFADSLRRKANHQLYKVSVLRSQVTHLQEYLQQEATELEILLQAKQAELEILHTHISALGVTEKEISESFTRLQSDCYSDSPVNDWEKMIDALNDIHHFDSKKYIGEYFKNPKALTEHEINLLTTNSFISCYSVGDQVSFACNEFYFITSGSIIFRKDSQTFGILQKDDLFFSSSLLESKTIEIFANKESFVCHLNSSVMASTFEAEKELLNKCFSQIAKKLAEWVNGITEATACTFSPRTQKRAHCQRKDLINVKVKSNQGESSCQKMLQLTSQATLEDVYNKCTTLPQCTNRKFVLKHRNSSGDVIALKDRQQVVLSLISDITRPVELEISFLQSEQVVVKQYECYFNHHGTLYLSQSEAVHFSTIFGVEKRKSIRYSDISEILPVKTCTLHIRTTNSKTYKLRFKSEGEASDVFRFVKVFSESSPQAIRITTNNEEIIGRAVVVSPFTATNTTQLSLCKEQIVIVSNTDDSLFPGFWYGAHAGCFGWFPKKCVKMHFEPEMNKQLIRKSIHTNLVDLPTESDWKLILKGSSVIKRKKGEIIVGKSEIFDGLYQIYSGECTVYKTIEAIDGRREEIKIGKLRTDEMFGEVTLLLGSNQLSVKASEDSELYALSAAYMEHIFRDNPIVAGRFFRYLCGILENRLYQDLHNKSQFE